MRILLVTNDYLPKPGGIQQYLGGLVGVLPAEVRVLAPRDEGTDRAVHRDRRGFMWPTRASAAGYAPRSGTSPPTWCCSVPPIRWRTWDPGSAGRPACPTRCCATAPRSSSRPRFPGVRQPGPLPAAPRRRRLRRVRSTRRDGSSDWSAVRSGRWGPGSIRPFTRGSVPGEHRSWDASADSSRARGNAGCSPALAARARQGPGGRGPLRRRRPRRGDAAAVGRAARGARAGSRWRWPTTGSPACTGR